MLTDADLPQLRADKTLWHTLRGVHLRGSSKPVELEVRWLWSKEYVDARTSMAFSKLSDEERQRAEVDLIAKHLVVGWRNVPNGSGGDESFDLEGCAKLLRHIHANALDIWSGLRASLGDPANFGRQPLVDAEALGEG